MAEAFVLLSGGIDSTTCLHLARRDFDTVEGVSVNYSQRHAKEMEYAERQCKTLGVPHTVLDIAAIMPKTVLTDPNADIPNKSYAEIEGVSPAYVPFRNGLMLAAIAALMQGRREPVGALTQTVYIGAHAEDARAWAYPDCSPEFMGAMANAIYIGTYFTARLAVPLQWMVKREIIQLGTSLGVNFADTWSCYKGGEYHCGVCPTCRARKDGFIAAGVPDPTQYADAGEI